jgi:hypothetical protein
MKTYTALHSFGDSFTLGTDLADCDSVNFSNFTWPAQVAKKLELPYTSFSKGGTGNQYIFSQLIEKFTRCHQKDRIFYVINWTWIERFDYIDVNTNHWNTTHPHHEGRLDHYFYKHIDSQVWNMIRNLQLMWGAIGFLKHSNCDFVMTCLDDTLWTRNYSEIYTTLIYTLQQLVKPYVVDFQNQNFLEWSKLHNFPMGATGHPLEDAHAAAAELMLPMAQSRMKYA